MITYPAGHGSKSSAGNGEVSAIARSAAAEGDVIEGGDAAAGVEHWVQEAEGGLSRGFAGGVEEGNDGGKGGRRRRRSAYANGAALVDDDEPGALCGHVGIGSAVSV